MISSQGHQIKKRQKANDVFITPVDLAKKHIKFVEDKITDFKKKIWYDPFKNSGNYYNNFNCENKEWSEILDNKDFFDFEGNVDVICSNPPYSMIDNVLTKSISLKPKIISYLLGINNLTSRRIEYMEQAGYYMKKIHLCKVWKWYGMSCIVVWVRGEGNGIIGYDRKVWR